MAKKEDKSETAAKKTAGGELKLQPLGDRVVIEREAAETITAGGIVLPDTAKDKPARGTVVSVGDGRLHDQRLMVCRTGRGQAAATLRREVLLSGAVVLPGERRSGSFRPGRTDTPDPLRLVG